MAEQDSVNIRRLREADKSAWGQHWAGYLAFYKATLPEQRTERLWARLMDGTDPIQCRVAELDGRVVGIVHFFPRPDSWFETVCYLADLYVDESMRGRGVGRALIDAVAEVAEAAGWHHVYWQTQTFNKPGRALYDSITGGASDFIVYRLGF